MKMTLVLRVDLIEDSAAGQAVTPDRKLRHPLFGRNRRLRYAQSPCTIRLVDIRPPARTARAIEAR